MRQGQIALTQNELTLATRLTTTQLKHLSHYFIHVSSPSEVVSVCCKPTSWTDPLHHAGWALFAVWSAHLANVRGNEHMTGQKQKRGSQRKNLDVTQVWCAIKVKLHTSLPNSISNIYPKMSATRYRRFLKLCEEWPRDEYKKGRDLGTFLRQRVASAFREGENTQVLQLNGHNTQLSLC